MVATLSKTRPLISRRDVAEQGMEIPNYSETLKCFGCTPPFFDLE